MQGVGAGLEALAQPSRNRCCVKRRRRIIRPHECEAMRRLLIAAATASMILAAKPPAEAKSFWLKCGYQVINLDSAKERFSLTFRDDVYQGSALFAPSQINFEFIYVDTGAIKLKRAYAISRKTLEYTATNLDRYAIYGMPVEEWAVQKIGGNPETGKCSIMKTPPNAGNKI
jgi:hypothetical protein